MAKQTQSTQQFVDIKEIKDGVVYLKRGGIRKILMVGGINFALKSQEEQELILRSFQNMLNTLDFSVQFFIHSRKVNISDYLDQVRSRKVEEENELLKIQIDDYVSFVESFVSQNPIITKSFFVVVPYAVTAVESGARGLLGGLLNFGSKKKNPSAGVAERIEDKKELVQLSQRVDEVVAGLEAVGLHATPLDDEALTELFYNLYNPQLIEKDDLAIAQHDENKDPTTV